MKTIGIQVEIEQFGRIGAYASGSYTCKCIKCDKQFIGDKRAQNCLTCAIRGFMDDAKAYSSMYNRVAVAFDKHPVAYGFLSEDGSAGLPEAIVAMAEEIQSLRNFRDQTLAHLKGLEVARSSVKRGEEA